MDCKALQPRIFMPCLYAQHLRVPADQILWYNAQKQIMQLQRTTEESPEPHPDLSTLVISIGVFFDSTHLLGPRAGYSVMSGRCSRHNVIDCIWGTVHHTIRIAEIDALWEALCLARRITTQDPELKRVVIATDSLNLYSSVTLWMDEWMDYDGTFASGLTVPLLPGYVSLYEELLRLWRSDGPHYQLWLVSREDNRDAYELAEIATDFSQQHGAGEPTDMA